MRGGGSIGVQDFWVKGHQRSSRVIWAIVEIRSKHSFVYGEKIIDQKFFRDVQEFLIGASLSYDLGLR